MKDNIIYQQVQNWIYRNARSLDLARWQYHFEQGEKEEVIHRLTVYQNRDGGFGHALEEDSWNPNSAPIQVFRAIELLNEIGFDEKQHPIIQGIMNYMDSGRDYEEGFWLNIVETNNAFPHAPWWHKDDKNYGHDRFNPSAGLAGFGLYYGERGSSLYEKCETIVKSAAEYILASEKLDMHVLRCFIVMIKYCRMAGITELYDSYRVEDKLRELVKHAITWDTSVWTDSYCCKPSFFFEYRDSGFYPENMDISDYEIDFIRRTRNQEGVWDITWGWSGYPEQWAISKHWWKADIAIKNVLLLRDIGGE